MCYFYFSAAILKVNLGTMLALIDSPFTKNYGQIWVFETKTNIYMPCHRSFFKIIYKLGHFIIGDDFNIMLTQCYIALILKRHATSIYLLKAAFFVIYLQKQTEKLRLATYSTFCAFYQRNFFLSYLCNYFDCYDDLTE